MSQTLYQSSHAPKMLQVDSIKYRQLQRKTEARDKLTAFLQQATDRYDDRLAKKPVVGKYPDLPVSDYRETLLDALKNHQIIIVTGDTGSGKTTQLPKICLEAGLADAGAVVMTQPRRIAARAVASRIADELSVKLGEVVGFQTRFERQVDKSGFIKVVTDGILLSEVHQNRFLNDYTAIIIDEAHERSLNIDFLLGYLKQLLPKRPDLKLIVTSATIATEDFASFFPDAALVEVPGRQFPVDIVYQPLEENEAQTDGTSALAVGVKKACEQAWSSLGSSSSGEGDVLVFLPGEREIHQVTQHLQGQTHDAKSRFWRDISILPLYGRLSSQAQQQIFTPDSRRRVVLATNIAETSLTVPRIRFVIDSGLARISRYSPNSKIQQLLTEPTSQASAKQRAGRCGRLMAGTCYRLYEEADFLARPAFTPPEILRMNLAAVVLQMLHLRLTPIEAFPFVSPPLSKSLNDAYKTLQALGALTEQQKLTKFGREMAKLPIEPKFARVLLEAKKLNIVYPALVIMAAMSIQDIRENPKDKREQARQAQAEYQDEASAFLFYWNCWQDLHAQRHALSGNAFRKYVQKRYLNHRRVREWFDMVAQLARLVRGLGWSPNFDQTSVGYADLHQAIITGFIDQVACQHEQQWYLGARGQKLKIFPGDPMSKRKPPWFVAGLWLETSQVFAHEVAKIQPEWIAKAAPHLLKVHYGEPYWQKRTSRVVSKQRQTLYGLTLSADKVVNYASIDPVASREVFIQQGLVADQLFSKRKAIQHNRALIQQLLAQQESHRRVDLLLTDIELGELYAQKLPPDVVDGSSFHRWYDKASREDPDTFCLSESELVQRELPEQPLPQSISTPVGSLALSYAFSPGAEHDGVTTTVPIAMLNQLIPETFSWLVPNWLDDKVTALIKALPKQYRRALVPAPDFARAALERLELAEIDRQHTALEQALAPVLSKLGGQEITSEMLQALEIEETWHMRFSIVDAEQHECSTGRDLRALQASLSQQATTAFAAISSVKADTKSVSETAPELPEWGETLLPEQATLQQSGFDMKVYLGLKANKRGLSSAAFETPFEADRAFRDASIQYAMQKCPEKYRYIRRKMPVLQQIKLLLIGFTDEDAWLEDFCYRVTDDVIFHDGFPRSQPELDTRIQSRQGQLVSAATKLAETLERSLQVWRGFEQRLKALDAGQRQLWQLALADMEQQRSRMIYIGFLREVPVAQLTEFGRYFKALNARLDKLEAGEIARDTKLRESIIETEQMIESRVVEHLDNYGQIPEALWKIRTAMQELRVSLFAQQLGTKFPISLKRIAQQWQTIEPETRILGVTR